MPKTLEVLFTPAEYAALGNRDLSQTVCVVFDIFRATSAIITALANGAAAIIPVAEIPEALALHRKQSDLLLAGERDGLRIRSSLTGGIDFHLGNSPREFTPAQIQNRTIVLSTTNGSRALRSCSRAKSVLIGSFLNLQATAQYLQQNPPDRLLLVCSGTADQAAYEDVLGAGALADLIQPGFSSGEIADSATIALQIYRQNAHALLDAAQHSRNGRRLMSIPDLRDDVPWCLQRDRFPLVAKMEGNSIVKLENGIPPKK